MARTYLSILTEEHWLENQLIQTIKLTGYSLGYSGNDEQKFIQFLKFNNVSNHILLVKPTRQYQSAYNETNLRSFSKIDVIIVGAPLLQEHIPLIQSSHISGYLTTNAIKTNNITDIVQQLYRHGYYANNEIPKHLWVSRPKKKQDYAQPKFTQRESEILNFLCHGFNGSEISFLIKTSESNVRNYIQKLKTKTQSYSETALVVIAVENKWVTLTREKFKRHNPYIMNPTQ